MKLYFKKRDDGEIAYYSDKDFDGAIAITISDADFEKIKQNYRLKFTDKLELEKPAYILEKEVKEAEVIKKAAFIDSVEKATSIEELKMIIINNI